MKKNVLLLLVLYSGFAFGQSGGCPALTNGARFIKETIVNSNAIYQEGAQIIDAGYKLQAKQAIEVDGMTGSGYSLRVTTTELIDSVNSLGQQQNYSSTDPGDTTSLIQKRIKDIVVRPGTISFHDKRFTYDSTWMSNDPLVKLAGLNSPFQPALFEMYVSFPFDSSFSVGYKWTASDTLDKSKKVTTYTLISKTNSTSTFSFQSSINGVYANTNTNGSLLVDNNTGLIKERISQSITLGYELLNNILCELDRKTAMIERFRCQ